MHESALGIAHAERKDGQPISAKRAQQFQLARALPRGQRALHEVRVALAHEIGAQRVLHQQDQRGADIAHHVGRARFLARFQAAAVIMALGRHELDGAAARPGRRGVEHRVAPHDQHARCARPADELVR
ncbi:hypothetical protein D3C87_1165750 [compost metagenome]